MGGGKEGMEDADGRELSRPSYIYVYIWRRAKPQPLQLRRICFSQATQVSVFFGSHGVDTLYVICLREGRYIKESLLEKVP